MEECEAQKGIKKGKGQGNSDIYGWLNCARSSLSLPLSLSLSHPMCSLYMYTNAYSYFCVTCSPTIIISSSCVTAICRLVV